HSRESIAGPPSRKQTALLHIAKGCIAARSRIPAAKKSSPPPDLLCSSIPRHALPAAAGMPRGGVSSCQMIPHPFWPQECDNAEMDQDSKPLQHRKDQRVARGRAVKKRPQVRLTPTDILKLLPPPIVLHGSSLTAIERQLSRRRERLERAMNARIRRDFVPQSRNLRIPSVARLEGLAKQVTMLPTRRKCLKRREFQIYLDTVHRLRDAIVAAIRKIRQSEQRDYQQRYLARVGQ